MLCGVGKSLMEVVYLSAGLMPSSVIMNPAKSASLLANLNFSALNTILVAVGQNAEDPLESPLHRV